MATPNLDCMDSSDVHAFAIAHQRLMRSRSAALAMFPDAPAKGRVKAFANIVHYAWNRYTAMECRRRGDIIAAQQYESICERIYFSLPEYAQW
jgi:hypothetical protein